MSGQRYQIAVLVNDTDGSTPLANTLVTLRQEATNEFISENTNSSGEAVFNLANFPLGWSVGDKVTAYVNYTAYEASETHTTTSGGGTTITLTLSALPTAPSIRYYAAQDFLDYFNMLTVEDDAENGVRMQQLVKIGEMVENGIDNDTETKFDDNDGSYYSVTDEFHDVEMKQQVYNLEKTPVATLKGFWINQANEGSVPNWKNIAYTSLDNCDTATNWSASSTTSEASVAVNLTPSNANEGLGCVYIAKSGTTDTTLTFQRTGLVSQNFKDKTLKIDLYLDDTDELASSDAVTLRYGSDSSNYYEIKFDRADLNDGWNTLLINWKDTDLTATGSPNIAAFDYFVTILELVAASTEWTSGDARLDDLRFEEQYGLSLDAAEGRATIKDSNNYAEKGNNQVRTTYTYGRSTVPHDIKLLAIIETGVKMFGAAFVKSKISNSSDMSWDSNTWFTDYRKRIISKYRVVGVTSVFGGS